MDSATFRKVVEFNGNMEQWFQYVEHLGHFFLHKQHHGGSEEGFPVGSCAQTVENPCFRVLLSLERKSAWT